STTNLLFRLPWCNTFNRSIGKHRTSAIIIIGLWFTFSVRWGFSGRETHAKGSYETKRSSSSPADRSCPLLRGQRPAIGVFLPQCLRLRCRRLRRPGNSPAPGGRLRPAPGKYYFCADLAAVEGTSRKQAARSTRRRRAGHRPRSG